MALPVTLVIADSSQTASPVLRITEHFANFRDPRAVGHMNHPLLTVLVIALVSAICGENGWEEFEEIEKDPTRGILEYLMRQP